jgi:hypothetical protein
MTAGVAHVMIETEPDGAHCKAAGTPDAIGERYEALPGDEYMIEDAGGRLVFKRLAAVPDVMDPEVDDT